jgi:2-amino-4-hydroxy-6-hydroxymethyldihydropteridine diphosphokinase
MRTAKAAAAMITTMPETPPAQALIALGGNVGDARDTIAQAIAAFCDGREVRLLRRSSDYETPPWGVEDQPPFINASLLIETSLAPRALLAHGQAIERQFGRDRSREIRWGPRSLDIDLIDYTGTAPDDPDLILPHPRALERAFVLVPLAEIAPDWRIGGMPVRDALMALDASGIRRLPDR